MPDVLPTPSLVPLQMTAPKRGKAPRHFADMTPQERRDVVTELGHQPFRAKQLETHYFSHLTDNADEMTDLPAQAKSELVGALMPPLVSKIRTLEADGGATVKTLWRLFDGIKIESVLMRYPTRSTLCVSSQAGCGMACPFCATGQMGLTRNLSTAEIVEQVRQAARALAQGDSRRRNAPE